MSFLFTCPHCQTQTLVEDQYSGLQGRCATCNHLIQIPEFAEQRVERASGGTSHLLSQPRVRWAAAAVASLLLAGCVLFVLVRYGGSAVGTMQANRSRAQDIRNLEKIAAALNAYAADHGVYPPPSVTSRAGQPMHSWRVLILPYLGHQSLYDRYDMDKPWDAPENQQLLGSVPPEYQSSGGQGSWSLEPHFFLVTGPGTLFPPEGPLGPGDVLDQPTQTLLVVEARQGSGASYQWMEPFDLDIRKMQMMIGANDGVEIGGNHDGGAMAATVDGRGHFLQDTLAPMELRALITPAGGEPLPDDILD